MKRMKTASAPCPYCEVAINFATSIDGPDRPPEAGDAAICIVCAQLLIYEGSENSLALRKPHPGETARMEAAYPEAYRSLLMMQESVRATDRKDLT